MSYVLNQLHGTNPSSEFKPKKVSIENFIKVLIDQQGKIIMNNYTQYMKELGNSLVRQHAAQDSASSARRDLALSLAANNINLNIKEQAAEVKLNTQKTFPKGTGKDADPAEKKCVQAIRQVVSTYRKGFEKNIMPDAYNSYSEWRKEVYNETPLTKLEQIKKWIDTNKIDTKEVQELLNTYKAITK